MAGLDPDEVTQTDVPQALPKGQQGVSQDVSQQSGLRKAWDAWTSRPENNAALINFGLNLLQPIQPGQTRMGHWAEAAGQGAEAVQRNVAAQEERQHYEEAQALKEQEAERKERETSAYEQYTRAMAGKTGMQSQLGLQKIAMQRWEDFLNKDEPLVGQHPVVAALAKQNPAWAKYKTKAEILADPAAAEAAKRMIMKQAMDDARTFGVGAGEDTNSQAIAWAKANPRDPRAAAVLKKVQGGGTEE